MGSEIGDAATAFTGGIAFLIFSVTVFGGALWAAFKLGDKTRSRLVFWTTLLATYAVMVMITLPIAQALDRMSCAAMEDIASCHDND